MPTTTKLFPFFTSHASLWDQIMVVSVHVDGSLLSTNTLLTTNVAMFCLTLLWLAIMLNRILLTIPFHLKMNENLFSVWMREVSANEGIFYTKYMFCHWLRPHIAIARKTSPDLKNIMPLSALSELTVWFPVSASFMQYHQTSSIRHTKYKNLKCFSSLILQLSLPSPLNPCVTATFQWSTILLPIKMWFILEVWQ